MRALAVLLALCAALWPAARAAAETVVPGLSQSRVAITANFDGSELLVFGAVRRDGPPPGGPPLHVVVTVEGPSGPVTVWRKSRRMGIWINSSAVRITQAPAFYAVATTGPLAEIISATEDLRHRVSIPRAIRSVGTAGTADAPDYIEALVRLRSAADLYQLREGSVELAEDALLRTSVTLPANLTEGLFTVRILLLRGGTVIDSASRTIDVQKVGIERFLFRLAREEPLAYGALALVLAIAAGWAASEGFRRLRG
ncbi:MAG: TIGR02186 family protein [Rhodobacteraceae bacterium]|nr:TIGR02186 family protein [Paracoccaceae bacterium]